MNIHFIKELIKKKFISDSILAIVGHVFVGVSGLIINSLIGLYFSTEVLGIFNQGLSIYLLLALLANCGIMISAQKHASQYIGDHESLKRIFSNTFVSTAILSTLISFLSYYVFSSYPNLFNSEDLLKFSVLVCMAVPFFALNKTMNNFMVGLRRMKVYSGIRVFRWSLIVLGIIIVSIDQSDFMIIPFIFLYTELALFFILAIYSIPFWGRVSFSQIKIHLSFGVKNILASLVDDIGIRMPILIIGYISGNVEAGLFAYVLSFARSILLIPQAIQKSFNPIFTKNWFENKHKKNELNISKVFNYSLLTLLPVLTLLYIFFISYTYFVMPSEYLSGHITLLILMIGMSTIYLFGPFATFLIMTDKLGTNFFRVCISTIINISLIFMLIYDHGNIGVAIAISTSMLFNIFIMDYLYKKNINIHLFKNTILNLKNA